MSPDKPWSRNPFLIALVAYLAVCSGVLGHYLYRGQKLSHDLADALHECTDRVMVAEPLAAKYLNVKMHCDASRESVSCDAVRNAP